MTLAPDERDTGLDLLLKKAGIEIPDSRYPAILLGYREIQAMMPLLRGPRTAAAEPAGTYVLETVTREGAA